MTKMIGIVGGVGPYAGLDLAKKIFEHTAAQQDQEHLDVLLVNRPRLIADRTAYLLARRGGDPTVDPANPGHGLVQCIHTLVTAGAEVIGVPCNTAHASAIFQVVERAVAAHFPALQLLHLVHETVAAVCTALPSGGSVGLLATPGAYASRVYHTAMAAVPAAAPYHLLEPDAEGKRRVREAIYDPEYGIKAQAAPVTCRAVDTLAAEVWRLYERGAQAVIMGCTEIPLALDGQTLPVPLLDPAVALARALIQAAAPERLRPLRSSHTVPAAPSLPWGCSAA